MTDPTSFIGIDLAWGTRHQTGLAAVSEGGDLLTLTQVQADDEIIAFCDRHAAGPTVVGFDAPLIVHNATGNRMAERLVARYFGRYQAFAHAANLGITGFDDGGRAIRLADRLGLDVDPASSSPRRCLEVYPHPAIVMLFGLSRVLPYKNRGQRTLPERRNALLALVGHLESLATAEIRLDVRAAPDWAAVRTAVETAASKAALSRSEDSIDAVVCAYIALHSVRRPEATAVLGTVADGYIVSPVDDAVRARILADREQGWPASTMERGDTVGMTDVLDPQTLHSALRGLPDWRVQDGALVAAYAAPTAGAALGLVAAIGQAAETADHHPDLDWRYDHVFVATTSHDLGGRISRRDIDLATRISALAVSARATAEPGKARRGA